MKKLIPPYLRVLVIFFTVFAAMEYFIDSGDQPAFIKFPMISLFLLVLLFVLIAVEITVNAVGTITYHLLTDEQKTKLEQVNDFSFKDSAFYKSVLNFLIKPKINDDEGLLLLDHDYDGIRELDNNLPPWWVYSFYACILFSIVYLVRFEILGADNQEMELKKELAQAQIEIAEYQRTAPDLMDENSVTLLTDASALAAGKAIYTANCVACHRSDAGGQIGPNLTDDQWILGGGIKNVFHTLVNGGRDGKGMISWKGTLKPKQMQQVASYVLSLKGSNPKDPKAPEGEVWVDPLAAKTDATNATLTDTTAVMK